MMDLLLMKTRQWHWRSRDQQSELWVERLMITHSLCLNSKRYSKKRMLFLFSLVQKPSPDGHCRTGPLKRNIYIRLGDVNVIEYVYWRKRIPYMIFLSPYEARTLCGHPGRTEPQDLSFTFTRQGRFHEHHWRTRSNMVLLSPSRDKDAMRTPHKDEIIYGTSQKKKKRFTKNCGSNGNRTWCSGSSR